MTADLPPPGAPAEGGVCSKPEKGLRVFVFDLVSAAAIMAGAIAVILYSRTLPLSESFSSGFGPGYWPSFLGHILLILGIVLLAETLMKKRRERRSAAGGEPPIPEPPPIAFASPGMRRIYKLAGILGAFVILLLTLRFMAALTFLVPACMRLLGERRLAVLAAMTIGTPAAVYVVFVRLMGVNLP